MMHATKNTSFKRPKDILRNENHLYVHDEK